MATTSSLRKNHLRDASFSSHRNFNGTADDQLFVVSLAGAPCRKPSPEKEAGDGEIDVFDAEWYFHGGMDDDDGHRSNKKTASKSELKGDDEEYDKKSSFQGTTSVGSTRNNSSPRKANKVNLGNWFFASLGRCKCTCFDTGSMVMDQYGDKSKMNMINIGKWASKLRPSQKNTQGSTDTDDQSDASSDLFEISILTPATASGYAPSEASVEWSVITASAADCSEFQSLPVPNNSSNLSRRRHQTALLGCQSNKALRVVGDAYR